MLYANDVALLDPLRDIFQLALGPLTVELIGWEWAPTNLTLWFSARKRVECPLEVREELVAHSQKSFTSKVASWGGTRSWSACPWASSRVSGDLVHEWLESGGGRWLMDWCSIYSNVDSVPVCCDGERADPAAVDLQVGLCSTPHVW